MYLSRIALEYELHAAYLPRQLHLFLKLEYQFGILSPSISAFRSYQLQSELNMGTTYSSGQEGRSNGQESPSTPNPDRTDSPPAAESTVPNPGCPSSNHEKHGTASSSSVGENGKPPEAQSSNPTENPMHQEKKAQPVAASENACENIRLRGTVLYKSAKKARDRTQLNIALTLFRRAAVLDSSSARPSDRASAHKNILAALHLQQQWDLDDMSIGFPHAGRVDSAFFASLRDAASSYTSAQTWASRSTAVQDRNWSVSLRNVYSSYIRGAITLLCLTEKPTEGGQQASTGNGYDSQLHLERFNYRVNGLEQIPKLSNCPLDVIQDTHFNVADVILKASVVSLANGDFSSAVSIIASSEHYLVCYDEIQGTMESAGVASTVGIEAIKELKLRVWYQVCAAKSAQRINQAKQEAMRSTESVDGSYKMWSILTAIDLLKEAQVLARETSLEHEAEAAARLAKIYRTFADVNDEMKSATYYKQAFNLLQSLGGRSLLNIDWVIDTKLARVRLQQKESADADARRAPILEKHKAMLDEIRMNLGLTDKEVEGLLFLYERYPPKNNKPPKEKLEKGDLKGAIKVVLLHYHPDRNREDLFGYEHSVVCEEITKYVNLMYSRKIKDV